MIVADTWNFASTPCQSILFSTTAVACFLNSLGFPPPPLQGKNIFLKLNFSKLREILCKLLFVYLKLSHFLKFLLLILFKARDTKKSSFRSSCRLLWEGGVQLHWLLWEGLEPGTIFTWCTSLHYACWQHARLFKSHPTTLWKVPLINICGI